MADSSVRSDIHFDFFVICLRLFSMKYDIMQPQIIVCFRDDAIFCPLPILCFLPITGNSFDSLKINSIGMLMFRAAWLNGRAVVLWGRSSMMFQYQISSACQSKKFSKNGHDNVTSLNLH